MVTLFASWCPPCREEFSHFKELHSNYSGTNLRIIAINIYQAWDENDAGRMQKFIKTTRPQFPTLVGAETIPELFGGIDRIPTVLGIDASGKVSYRFIHKRGATKKQRHLQEIDLAVRELLSVK